MGNASRAGRFVTQLQGPSGFSAFVPAGLPPDPPIRWDSEMHDLFEIAKNTEAPGIPIDDLREVSNYVAAMEPVSRD